MHPHVILRDIAWTRSLDDVDQVASPKTAPGKSGTEQFETYLKSLLRKPRQNSVTTPLTPSTPVTLTNQASLFTARASMQERIEAAILNGTSNVTGQRMLNSFTIQKAGSRIAIIKLARLVYRLGEVISATIDFSGSSLPCYALHIFLESAETIDPAFAIRSASSIQRATRRVHGSWFEQTVSTRRVMFNAMVPVTATPGFSTSVVELQWRLRFDFVTQTAVSQSATASCLVEEVESDDRGQTLAALQGLPCEAFEVEVPIRVLGNLGASGNSKSPTNTEEARI
jgi:hypothetical protein